MFDQELCEKFAKEIAKANGLSLEEAQEFGLKVRPDSNDWASSDDGAYGFIMWEEGPYEWAYSPVSIDGFYMEAICGWGLVGIYEI